jgi:hypothetical protein
VPVTITETKTGTPSDFSRRPVNQQSLKGIGNDGKLYEKHWDYWPESQTNDFMDCWSLRDDGAGSQQFWTPKEAVHAYNNLQRFKKQNKDAGELVRLDVQGQQIMPKGDIVFCKEHDRYYYQGGNCIHCLVR